MGSGPGTEFTDSTSGSSKTLTGSSVENDNRLSTLGGEISLNVIVPSKKVAEQEKLKAIRSSFGATQRFHRSTCTTSSVVSSITSASGSTSREPLVLYGREEETRTLLECLEKLILDDQENGMRQLVWITGESGTGKSALAATLGDRGNAAKKIKNDFLQPQNAIPTPKLDALYCFWPATRVKAVAVVYLGKCLVAIVAKSHRIVV